MATTSTPKSYLEFLERAGGGAVGGYNNFWLAVWNEVHHGRRAEAQLAHCRSGRRQNAADEARSAEAQHRVPQDRQVSPDAAEGATAAPAGAFDGPEARPLAERCLLGFLSTSGPPTLPNYFYNNLKQIVQTRDTIMILNEMVHDARFIRMNATHPPAEHPQVAG